MPQATSKNRTKSYHVLSFHWEDFQPVLELHDFVSDVVERVVLKPGMDFSLQAGNKRFCVGRQEEGVYRPCPEKRQIEQFNQCQACASIFIPKLECIFEPQCDGSLCDANFCKKPHVVYLALFKDEAKVGLTSRDRVSQRLIEQGADAYSIIAETRNRLEARSLEKKIARSLRLPQVYYFSRFVGTITNGVTQNSMEEVYHHNRDRLKRTLDLDSGPLEFLKGYPMPETVNGKVYPQDYDRNCQGTILGIKGKGLVFRAQTFGALNLFKLPARIVKANFQIPKTGTRSTSVE